MNRTPAFSNILESIERKADQYAEDFDLFGDGYRVLMLLHRKKDGGHNKEKRRVKSFYIYNDREEFKRCLYEALVIKKVYDEEYRLYLSVNPRDITKAIRYMKGMLLEAEYCGSPENAVNIYEKVFKDARTFLMQPQCKKSQMFLLDVDDEEGKDTLGDVLKIMAEKGIVELFRTRTKNGWHIITEPFNSKWMDKVCGVNKDGLVLIES